MKHACRLGLLVIFNSVTLTSYSQHANNWYFAHRAGITFNTNPPSALADGVMDTNEGCSAISDTNGQLLFYTDGATVWNKLHQVMPNGTNLKGNWSATNSAIIIPKPGSDSIYYIFTTGAEEANNEGYFFSEVDISLQGGLGDVTAAKNILLYSPGTEKLTAVRHSNGLDVWVITRVFGTAAWKTFKIDCNGVNTTPVTSFSDNPASVLWKDANTGCLKASPDGTKIATANSSNDLWEILQFDASTGILSNNLYFNSNFPYGVEFSPNSKFVYISNIFAENEIVGGISQYDISIHDSAAIASSKVFLGKTDGFGGALQLGPDKKIYCSVGIRSYLGAINNPDVAGIACGFTNHQLDLAFGTRTYLGLPVSFPRAVINLDADYSYIIQSDCTTIDFTDNSATTSGNITAWQWDFGDGNTAALQNPTHTYSTPGSYIVKLMVQLTNGCISDTVSKTIDIAAKPEVAFTNTEACIGQQIQFTNQTILASGTITGYSWDFGDGSTSAIESPVHTYSREGDFTATLTAFTGNGCTATSTKTFHIAPVRAFAGNDTTVVTGQPVPLHASGGKFFQWPPPDFLNKDNVFNPVAILDQDQHYRVQVTTEEGCTDYDDITIHVIKGTDIYVP
ncbi:MAG: PKD domain-containing protein, partial [Sphingobacteriales bacterium]